MSTKGSDCPTGKEQFASKEAASERVLTLRRRGFAVRTFRCEMCGCIHIGHRRRADKKRMLGPRRRG